MKKNIVIKVDNISKIYKLYNKPIDRVKEALNPLNKKYHKEFNALDSISFELKAGETLGVMGRNGHGKSTLLKIIAGVLTPSKGRISSRGKIAAILELTSSLRAELTGKENIFFNLKINGYTTKLEIDAKLKEIEEFAEIGEFINQPIKTYSSGMKSRLGFGIATSIEPDILILDEVLAVGDFIFQQKCLAKINAMRDTMSVIFVSHSINSIKLFCDRAIVLEKGKMIFNGSTQGAIDIYLEKEDKEKLKKLAKKSNSPNSFYGKMFHNQEKISHVEHKWTKSYCKLDEEMIFEFSFYLKYKSKNLIIGLPIWDEMGNYITSYNTDYYTKTDIFGGGVHIKGRLKSTCYFNPGEYESVIVVVDGSEYLYRQRNNSFIVANKERVFGFVSLPHQWEID